LEGALISLASLIVVLLLVLRGKRREKARIDAGFMPLRSRPVPQRVDSDESDADFYSSECKPPEYTEDEFPEPEDEFSEYTEDEFSEPEKSEC
ncbi:MAG: hypothetical protein GX749_01395, partial [Ruminococcaceae bacterium]|nr:hypothetical protein [Oscillospiraceae bacterium]